MPNLVITLRFLYISPFSPDSMLHHALRSQGVMIAQQRTVCSAVMRHGSWGFEESRGQHSARKGVKKTMCDQEKSAGIHSEQREKVSNSSPCLESKIDTPHQAQSDAGLLPSFLKPKGRPAFGIACRPQTNTETSPITLAQEPKTLCILPKIQHLVNILHESQPSSKP